MFLCATGEMLEQLRYRTEGEVEAARWLEENTGPDDVVLCTYFSGNYLGGRIPGRVWVGHRSGTLGLDAKLAGAREFFAGDAGEAAKRSFLLERGIDYVFYGPREWEGASPSTRAFLESMDVAFLRGPVAVYAVAAHR
jgi:hypothetical protein